MKVFKQKVYTIQEGHYTGPKDMESIPGTIEVLAKSTFGGAGAGAIVGKISKELGSENVGIMDGLKTGGKAGFLAGIALKGLLNHLHKPMTKVKFQEVDKMIRKEFGMHRIIGISFGDSRENRRNFDDKFSINDRDITKYKLTFCIQNNQVTMYTYHLTDDELDKINNSLDYYCKKYSGMEYSSRVIGSRTNTYSVNITFTNYNAISSFIIEVQDNLNIKVNLMDNNGLVETRIGNEDEESVCEDRVYSNLPVFSKYDLMNIFTKSGIRGFDYGMFKACPMTAISLLVMQTILESLAKLGYRDKAILEKSAPRFAFDDHYIESSLKRLGFIEGVHYTVGENLSNTNISMYEGHIIITVRNKTKDEAILKKIMKGKNFKESDINGKATVWTGIINTKGDFDILLKSIVNSTQVNILVL